MTDPDDLLLSDSERLHALTALGDHYAAGRLDDPEFHSRSGDIAAARTLGQLRSSFRDLPGGMPLSSVDGMIVQTAAAGGGELARTSSSPAVSDPDRELQDLRKRGKTVETLDGLVLGATLVAFLVLQFVVGWDYAWIVWPSLVLTLGVPRAILQFSDSDEELYEELKESDDEARKERLRAATERIRELGDGRETH
ncbi:MULTISPECIES: DUF1707 domain-containing protein [unclassified Dietzia]|uniref:DUF1707 SHOCT-like domain-containing protein n=1 Tax=unclassified Dietzia TaxID=2617939 RepID=UPI000D20851A|nr:MULTISPECIES: DUF1707 domain-containing protein [unclassified Dietzia]AVZ40693.1 hypothetical protein CT688_15695 [Dietzia sp. JS16-p6b]MBB1025278.1 DUF1707 domain-containing protein [Dietzia sp. DQ12-76]MBB1026942.1 DUF1707 domain-containing protein [Dietzia sp. DQ11-38-2]QGW26273.1 hypothetical protein GJR88_04970 [Dietzia sp. DQ12-45-1b]